MTLEFKAAGYDRILAHRRPCVQLASNCTKFVHWKLHPTWLNHQTAGFSRCQWVSLVGSSKTQVSLMNATQHSLRWLVYTVPPSAYLE